MRFSGRVMITLAMLVLIPGLAGCPQNEGPVERAGKAVDKAVDKAGDAVDKAGDNVRDAVKDSNKN